MKNINLQLLVVLKSYSFLPRSLAKHLDPSPGPDGAVLFLLHLASLKTAFSSTLLIVADGLDLKQQRFNRGGIYVREDYHSMCRDQTTCCNDIVIVYC